jgi:hypothetical protein
MKKLVLVLLVLAVMATMFSCVKPHTHEFGDWTTEKEATCIEEGEEKRTCACGEYETRNIPITDHIWQDATCISPKTCSVCGKTEGEALGHKNSEATCTEPQICKTCGEITGDPLGHNYQSATCTQPQKCTRCGATQGSALGHNYKDATCTEPKKCTRCGATTGSALGHSLKDGVCTRCGYVDVKSSDKVKGAYALKAFANARTYIDYMADKIERAWYFAIYRAEKYYTGDDTIKAYANTLGVKENLVRNAVITCLEKHNYETTNLYAMALLRSNSGAIEVAETILEEMADSIRELILEGKKSVEEMSGQYDNETGYTTLVSYYSELANYYNWAVSPTGSYSTLSSTVTGYQNRCSQYENKLDIIY